MLLRREGKLLKMTVKIHPTVTNTIFSNRENFENYDTSFETIFADNLYKHYVTVFRWLPRLGTFETQNSLF